MMAVPRILGRSGCSDTHQRTVAAVAPKRWGVLLGVTVIAVTNGPQGAATTKLQPRHTSKIFRCAAAFALAFGRVDVSFRGVSQSQAKEGLPKEGTNGPAPVGVAVAASTRCVPYELVNGDPRLRACRGDVGGILSEPSSAISGRAERSVRERAC